MLGPMGYGIAAILITMMYVIGFIVGKSRRSAQTIAEYVRSSRNYVSIRVWVLRDTKGDVLDHIDYVRIWKSL